MSYVASVICTSYVEITLTVTNLELYGSLHELLFVQLVFLEMEWDGTVGRIGEGGVQGGGGGGSSCEEVVGGGGGGWRGAV